MCTVSQILFTSVFNELIFDLLPVVQLMHINQLFNESSPLMNNMSEDKQDILLHRF